MMKPTRTLWRRIRRPAILDKLLLKKKTPPQAERPEPGIDKKILPDKEIPKKDGK